MSVSIVLASTVLALLIVVIALVREVRLRRALQEAANSAGGSDNVTVVVSHFREGQQHEARALHKAELQETVDHAQLAEQFSVEEAPVTPDTSSGFDSPGRRSRNTGRRPADKAS